MLNKWSKFNFSSHPSQKIIQIPIRGTILLVRFPKEGEGI